MSRQVRSSVTLRVNGKPFNPNPLSPSTEMMLKYLATLPADEIFDNDTTCVQAKISRSVASHRHFRDQEVFKGYTIKWKGLRYWGSKKAVAEFRRQVGL